MKLDPERHAALGLPVARMPTIRPLSVLIVTYKSHELVETVSGPGRRALPELPVYVYENSGDPYPGREELAARHPDVHWVIGPVNLGFAAAANALVEARPRRHRSALPRRRRAIARTADPHSGADCASPAWQWCRRWCSTTGDLARNPGTWQSGSGRWPAPWCRSPDTPILLRRTPFSQLHRRQPAESDSIDGYVTRSAWRSIARPGTRSADSTRSSSFTARRPNGRPGPGRRAGASCWPTSSASGTAASRRAPSRPMAQPWASSSGAATTTCCAPTSPSCSNTNSASTTLTRISPAQSARPCAALEARSATPHIARRENELPEIIITTNSMVDGEVERQKAMLATELDRRGYTVTVVCLQRFGALVKEIPHTVRVVRQPGGPPPSTSPRVRLSSSAATPGSRSGSPMLWRIAGARRRWLVAADPSGEDGGVTHSRRLAKAMRRADGFLAAAENICSTTPADVEAMADTYVEAIEGVLAPDVGVALRDECATCDRPIAVDLTSGSWSSGATRVSACTVAWNPSGRRANGSSTSTRAPRMTAWSSRAASASRLSSSTCRYRSPLRAPATRACGGCGCFDRISEFVQFVDGDCELDPSWIATALQVLDNRPDVAVVCGRVRERFRNATIYNRLCDIEWNTPIGEAEACGGIALMRAAAVEQAGYFDPSLICGEEADLCRRIRYQGQVILRVDADMTLHDAAMTRAIQWWRRTKRGGFSSAEAVYRLGSEASESDRHSVRGVVVWVAILPVLVGLSLAVAALCVSLQFALVLATGAMALVILQTARIARRRASSVGENPADSWLYAVSLMAAKLPKAVGMLRCWRLRRRREVATLIEWR